MAIWEEESNPELEREQLLENANIAHQHDLERRQFDLKMFEIKVLAREASRATARKQRAIERVLLGVVKAPALVVLALLIPLVVLAGREVPKFIQMFMTL